MASLHVLEVFQLTEGAPTPKPPWARGMVSPSPHSCLSGLGQGARQEPHWAPVAVLVGAVGRQEPRPSAGSPRARGAQGPIDYLPASTFRLHGPSSPGPRPGEPCPVGTPQTLRLDHWGQPSRPDVPERGLSKGPWTGREPALHRNQLSPERQRLLHRISGWDPQTGPAWAETGQRPLMKCLYELP